MLKKLKIASRMKAIVLALLVLSSIAFVERNNDETICQDIRVDISDTEENYFLDDEAVIDLVTSRGRYPLKGEKLIHIELKTLESRIKKDKFVKSVQISKNLNGILSINVKQRRPIARFLCADTSFYVGSEGYSLPLSNRYTARTVVVFGSGAKNYFRSDSVITEQDQQLFDVLDYIYHDDFLRAQIAEIEINKKGEMTMYPQVTKQPILFGDCEQYVDKFKRLRVFYDKILPAKGWNDYETVNLKYQGQIICK